MFFSFSKQSHAESFRNFVKNSVLDPKRAKLKQKSSFGVSGGRPGGRPGGCNQEGPHVVFTSEVSKGGRPTSMVYRMTPSDQTSTCGKGLHKKDACIHKTN